MGDLSIQKPYRTDSNILDNERQEYLESLWSDNNLTRVLKFYKELRDVSEMINFSVGRKPAEIKIIRRGNLKSNMKFIIPTMDHNSQQCKMLEKNYKNYEILFIESSGKLFNYSKSVNAGISEVLGDEKSEIIIISNDDIIMSSSGFQEIKNLTQTEQSVYCLKPEKQNYSGESLEIAVPSTWAKLYEGFKAARNGFRYQADLISLLTRKKFNYARAFSREFLSHNFLMIGSKSITGKFVNFADFGVFNISILRENRFDETFINGWEDWDLSYRLKQKGINILPLNISFVRNAHSSIGRVMSKESEVIHSYLNRIYFFEKHSKLKC